MSPGHFQGYSECLLLAEGTATYLVVLLSPTAGQSKLKRWASVASMPYVLALILAALSLTVRRGWEAGYCLWPP